MKSQLNLEYRHDMHASDKGSDNQRPYIHRISFCMLTGEKALPSPEEVSVGGVSAVASRTRRRPPSLAFFPRNARSGLRVGITLCVGFGGWISRDGLGKHKKQTGSLGKSWISGWAGNFPSES
jgi:hypothetical protein